MKTIALSFILLLAASLTVADTININCDKSEIAEGGSVNCTISREQTDGDLPVYFSVGMPQIKIVDVKVSEQWGNSANALIDGRLDTFWQNRGNSTNEGKDDNPSTTFYFANPSAIAAIQIANYVNPGHTFRGPNDILFESSIDGITFTPLESHQLRRGTEGKIFGSFETFPLNITAKAIRLTVKSNHSGREFGKGSSFEGVYSNGSIVGLMEVAFSSAGANLADVKTMPLSITIPDGKNETSFTMNVLDDKFIEGDEALEIRLNWNEKYTIGKEYQAICKLIDNDFGDIVSIKATTETASEDGEKAGSFTFSRDGNKGDLAVRYTTSTQVVPVIAASASSVHNGTPAYNAIDGSLETYWMNTGNALRESEMDDEPWIIFTFDKIYIIGQMRAANLQQSGHNFRGANEFELLVSSDMANFTSLGTRKIPSAVDNGLLPEFALLDLGGVEAKRVMLRILSNQANREFWQGKSYEGNYANGSFVGISEVQFMTGSSAGNIDLKEKLSGTITIPDGQQSVTLSIIPLDDDNKEDNETIILTVIPDYINYTVSENSVGKITITDND